MRYLRLNIETFYLIFLWASSCATGPVASQSLKVVSRPAHYRQSVEGDSLQCMAEVKTAIPSVVYDLRYATKNNFTGKKLYKQGDKTFLRTAVVTALQKVAEELLATGYSLKIWDAYRPYSVTKKMWDLIGDERYVADPAKGSGHNRGLAVDLTLMKDGSEVNMGTGFDNFSDTAHHNFKNLPQEVLQNRLLLRTAMEKHGFTALATEWWHYSFPNDGRYEVLNIPFRKFNR